MSDWFKPSQTKQEYTQEQSDNCKNVKKAAKIAPGHYMVNGSKITRREKIGACSLGSSELPKTIFLIPSVVNFGIKSDIHKLVKSGKSVFTIVGI